MTIDPQTAIGLELPAQRYHWDQCDIRRYRSAVGQDARLPGVMPTFVMTAPGAFGVVSPDFHHSEAPEIRFPGIRLDLSTLLHQEQELIVHDSLPATGELACRGAVIGVEDRGGAAVLIQRTTVTGPAGNLLVSGLSRVRAQGQGRPGMPPDRSTPRRAPGRHADFEIVTRTTPYQALLYQRCGVGVAMTGNVHTDPEFARAAGLDRPILQGACTYGLVCVALAGSVLESDVSRIRRYSARFTGLVYPGDILHTRIWVENGGFLFTTSVPARADRAVLVGALNTG